MVNFGHARQIQYWGVYCITCDIPTVSVCECCRCVCIRFLEGLISLASFCNVFDDPELSLLVFWFEAIKIVSICWKTISLQGFTNEFASFSICVPCVCVYVYVMEFIFRNIVYNLLKCWNCVLIFREILVFRIYFKMILWIFSLMFAQCNV